MTSLLEMRRAGLEIGVQQLDRGGAGGLRFHVRNALNFLLEAPRGKGQGA